MNSFQTQVLEVGYVNTQVPFTVIPGKLDSPEATAHSNSQKSSPCSRHQYGIKLGVLSPRTTRKDLIISLHKSLLLTDKYQGSKSRYKDHHNCKSHNRDNSGRRYDRFYYWLRLVV